MKVCELVEILSGLEPELEVRIEDKDYETGLIYTSIIESYTIESPGLHRGRVLLLKTNNSTRITFTGKHIGRTP